MTEVYDSADEPLGGGLPKFGAAPDAAASVEASDHFMVLADITVPADAAGCQLDADCDDGLFCNGQEICDVAQDCQPGTPPSLDDGVGCKNGTDAVKSGCVSRTVLSNLSSTVFAAPQSDQTNQSAGTDLAPNVETVWPVVSSAACSKKPGME